MNNPPAFPRPFSHDGIVGLNTEGSLQRGDLVKYEEAQDGMTLRDYFAAKALAARISLGKHPDVTWDEHVEGVTRHAYEFADAMLKAREAK